MTAELLTSRDAAQRIADVINEVREAGFSASMQDWPECMVTVVPVHEAPTYLNVVYREGRWVVEAP